MEKLLRDKKCLRSSVTRLKKTLETREFGIDNAEITLYTEKIEDLEKKCSNIFYQIRHTCQEGEADGYFAESEELEDFLDQYKLIVLRARDKLQLETAKSSQVAPHDPRSKQSSGGYHHNTLQHFESTRSTNNSAVLSPNATEFVPNSIRESAAVPEHPLTNVSCVSHQSASNQVILCTATVKVIDSSKWFDSSPDSSAILVNHLQVRTDNLHDNLSRIDELPTANLHSKVDQESEVSFTDIHSGQEVREDAFRLPCHISTVKLGDSLQSAMRQFQSPEKSLVSSAETCERDKEFIQECADLQPMERVPVSRVNSSAEFRLYHDAGFKESTTRQGFAATVPDTGCANSKKRFHPFGVHSEDDLQRTLLRNNSSEPILPHSTLKTPVKSQLLPGQQLCLALLFANLLKSFLLALVILYSISVALSNFPIELSCDSSESRPWIPFVANRVAETEAVPNLQCNHVVEFDNPTNCSTRGLPPEFFSCDPEVPNASFLIQPSMEEFVKQLPTSVYYQELQSVEVKSEPVVGEIGELVITNPFPSFTLGIWGDTDGSMFREKYFSQHPGMFTMGDYGIINPITKGFIICGRCDETLKQRGCRFGSSEIYNVVDQFPEIRDCLCVSQYNKDLDERAVLFVKLRDGYSFNIQLVSRIREAIARELTIRHIPDVILETKDIPYNMNGKKMEIIVKKIINKMPHTTEAVINQESLPYYYNVPELQLPF